MTPMHRGPAPWQRPLSPGVSIATAADRVGALGAVVFDRDTGRPLLLGAGHVLVEPSGGTKVWQPAPCGEPGCECNVVGQLLRSRCAVVRFRDEWFYIDAAVASLDDDVEWEAPLSHVTTPVAGMRVRKVGPATGCTEGVVIDACHIDRVLVGYHELAVPNQIRIRPLPAYPRFAGGGDSGALVFDTDGGAVGMLWGADGNGLGVASPIGPVLAELKVSVERGTA